MYRAPWHGSSIRCPNVVTVGATAMIMMPVIILEKGGDGDGGREGEAGQGDPPLTSLYLSLR